MNNDAPAFQWYPKDILTSAEVLEMTLAEEGAYRRLIDVCWISGSIPADPAKAARVVGKGCTVEMAKAALRMFVPDPENPDRMVHEYLNREREKQSERRRKASESARVRWEKETRVTASTGGEKASSELGDKALLKEDSCDGNANACNSHMRRQCSSSSSSNNIYITPLHTYVCAPQKGENSTQKSEENPTSSQNLPKSRDDIGGELSSDGEESEEKPPSKPKAQADEAHERLKRTVFKPPTLAEVREYGTNCGFRHTDYRDFWEFYESKGWFVGKNKMKNWHMALSRWERNQENRGNYGTKSNDRNAGTLNDPAKYDIEGNWKPSC